MAYDLNRCEELRRLYHEEMKSLDEIAALLGMNYSATRRAFIGCAIERRTLSESRIAANPRIAAKLTGRKRPHTKETKAKISLARTRWGDKNAKGVSRKAGRVEITRGENKGRPFHVVLIENTIGRRLAKGEVVHHKDRNTGNNDLENLQLMTNADHCRLHRNEEIAAGKLRERNNRGQFK